MIIQNESLEYDVAGRNRLIATIQADVEATRCDLDWLLRVGLVRVVDKLVEHPDFTGIMSLICHSAFVAGVESSRSGLMFETGSRSVRSNIGSVPSVNDALLAFASMDHASLLGLGDLDIQEVHALCAFTGSEGTPKDMVVDDDENVVGDTSGGNGSGGDASDRVGDSEGDGELIDGVEVDGGGGAGGGDDDGGPIGGVDVDIGDGDNDDDGGPVSEDVGGDVGSVNT